MAVTLECDIPKNDSNELSGHFVEEISRINGWEISDNTFSSKSTKSTKSIEGRRETTTYIISRSSGHIRGVIKKEWQDGHYIWREEAKYFGDGMCELVSEKQKKF